MELTLCALVQVSTLSPKWRSYARWNGTYPMCRCRGIVRNGDRIHDRMEPDQLLGRRLSLQRTERAHVLTLLTKEGGHSGYVSHDDCWAWHTGSTLDKGRLTCRLGLIVMAASTVADETGRTQWLPYKFQHKC